MLRPEERQPILAGLDVASRRELARAPQQNRVVVARLDLNADGRQELFADWMGPLFCGPGGCTLQLFTPGPDSGAGAGAASGADGATGAGPGERRAPQPASEGTAEMVGDPVLADGAPL